MSNLKCGDLVQIIHDCKVVTSDHEDKLIVQDVDNKVEEFEVTGRELIKSIRSADYYENVSKVTQTQLAETLIATNGGVFTCTFRKKDGELRKIRGKFIAPEPLMGRSKVLDLDNDPSDRLRQIDHRTIQSIIFEGVKYEHV